MALARTSTLLILGSIQFTYTHNEVIHIKISSEHKEATPRGRKLNFAHVRSLKSKLSGYGVDPFSKDCPKHLTRWDKIGHNVVADLLKAADIGKDQFKSFVQERLITGKTKSVTLTELSSTQ